MIDSYEKQVDITAAIVAAGAGNAVDLDADFPIVPKAICIMAAAEGVARVDGTPLRGDTVVRNDLMTNRYHPIAFKSIEFDNTTTDRIVIAGDNI